jgi:DUF971 family protein
MRPTGISADRASATLTVTWDNQDPSTVSFKTLSDACPCELCESERRNPDPLKILRARSYDLEAINPVGAYAINIMWRGGCHYGIYKWEYLAHLAQAYPAVPPEPKTP